MPKKPMGLTGPMSFSGQGFRRHLIEFPDSKEEIEELIASLFVKGMEQRDDNLKPFGKPEKNSESDVDFTISSSAGKLGLELTEFAPLKELGINKHTDAPDSFSIDTIAQFAFNLIMRKSNHYSKGNRILVIYKTQEQFFISPPIIEMLRRKIGKQKVNFLKIYGVSPHSLTDSSVDLIYPAVPHPFHADKTDEQLGNILLHVGFRGFRDASSYYKPLDTYQTIKIDTKYTIY